VTTTRRITITNVLIGINVLAYLWQWTTGGLDTSEGLFDHGALLGIACTDYGQWWRIVTGAFLHGSPIHIGSNMLALYFVGQNVEAIFGKLRYSLLYAISLAGAGLAIVYTAPHDLTVGASGAIFGLFGALVAVGLRLGKRGRGLIGQVLPVIVINLVITFSVPNISAAGHIGGLITGFAVGLVLFMMPSRRRDMVYAYAAEQEAPPQAAVETIEHPPAAGPHESDAVPPEVRDPRE
jgi:membrane associated rhomboid family serine protease